MTNIVVALFLVGIFASSAPAQTESTQPSSSLTRAQRTDEMCLRQEDISLSGTKPVKSQSRIAREPAILNTTNADQTTLNSTPASTITKAADSIIRAKYKNNSPSSTVLKQLAESDKPALIQEFREQPLTNKIHSFWALTYLGGDDVREEFRRILEDEYANQSLHSDEMRAIESIAIGLGYLAKDDALAYNYLLDHLKPDDWIGLRKWEIIDSKLDLNAFISEAMIIGVGISGRDDAQKVLENVLKWDEKSLDLIGEGVAEAFGLLNQWKTVNRKDAVLISMTKGRVDIYMSWIKTDEGKKWNNWFRVREKLPPL